MRLILAIAFLFVSFTASADQYATVLDSYPVYTERYVERYETVCYDAVYGGNALSGAIIGGLIGNQFGNGDGRDAMTVLGAIIGADMASRPTVGQRCERVRRLVSEPLVSYYIVRYSYNGSIYEQRTDRNLRPGQTISVRMVIR
jgi:uncharacterized protein YcfJ